MAPGSFCNLRSGWEPVSESGVMDEWRYYASSVDCLVASSDVFRTDICWWRTAIEARPSKRI